MTQRKSIEDYNSITAFLLSNSEFILEGDILTCTLCYKKYTFDPARGITNVRKHINSQKHRRLLDIKNSNITIGDLHDKDTLFMRQIGLVEFMTKMNYPLSDVDSPAFKAFAQKNFAFPLCSSGFYRNSVVPRIFADKFNQLRTILTDKPFYIILDSTTDSNSRQIMCVIIGECAANNESVSYFLGAFEMKECKADNYATEIIKILCMFFGSSLDFNLFRVLITDQAPVMLSAGRLLKQSFREMKHVSCLAHLCHNVAEKVRGCAVIVDMIISTLKRLLIKNKTNNELFFRMTGLKPYKFPILIRWGMWIEFSGWLYENYVVIGEFIKEMDRINNTNYFLPYNSTEFEREIRLCKSYEWIPVTIKEFEKQNTSTEKQIQTLNTIIERTKNSFLEEYILKSLSKNPDIDFFISFNELRSRQDEKIYAYIPLTSVEVERAFSIYRKIYSEQRQSLKVENLSQFLFLYFNKSL